MSEPENNDITLSVHVEKLKFSGNLLRFQLNIETNDPGFRDPKYTVVRLYKDFAWLNDKFRDNKQYLGIALPNLPAKLSLDSNIDHFHAIKSSLNKLSPPNQEKFEKELEKTITEEMRLSKLSHQEYLNELTSHPVLRKDPLLKFFLEYRDCLKDAVKGKKYTLYHEMDSLVETCLSNGDKRFPPILTECTKLIKVLENHNEVVDCGKNVCYSLAGVSLYLEDLAEKTDETWKDMSEALKPMKDEARRGHDGFREMVYGLTLNFGFADAKKYLVLSEFHTKFELNDILHDFHKMERQRLDTTQIKKELDAQKEYFHSLEEQIKPELTRLRDKSVENYKVVFSNLAASQLASSQAMENCLNESLAELCRRESFSENGSINN